VASTSQVQPPEWSDVHTSLRGLGCNAHTDRRETPLACAPLSRQTDAHERHGQRLHLCTLARRRINAQRAARRPAPLSAMQPRSEASGGRYQGRRGAYAAAYVGRVRSHAGRSWCGAVAASTFPPEIVDQPAAALCPPTAKVMLPTLALLSAL
jgi:hypothetical protein